MNVCIRYGWDKTENEDDVLVSLGDEIKYPENGWLSLAVAFTQSDSFPDFNMSHIDLILLLKE